MSIGQVMTEIDSAADCGAGNAGLRQELQAVLGQLFDLHVQGVEAHAHFIGTRFTGMQRQLEDVVQTAREASAAVAELLRGFDSDFAPGLILAEIAPTTSGLRPGERCTTAAVNMITHRISLLLNTIRCVSKEADGTDRSTADLLSAIADIVDSQARSLAAESRRINSQANSVGSER
jgi:starvation-inducible DNA-binding protein